MSPSAITCIFCRACYMSATCQQLRKPWHKTYSSHLSWTSPFWECYNFTHTLKIFLPYVHSWRVPPVLSWKVPETGSSLLCEWRCANAGPLTLLVIDGDICLSLHSKYSFDRHILWTFSVPGPKHEWNTASVLKEWIVVVVICCMGVNHSFTHSTNICEQL